MLRANAMADTTKHRAALHLRGCHSADLRGLHTEVNDIRRTHGPMYGVGAASGTACHLAPTKHRQMAPEEQKKAGVASETCRLSVGIRHADKITEDLEQTLDAAMASKGVRESHR